MNMFNRGQLLRRSHRLWSAQGAEPLFHALSPGGRARPDLGGAEDRGDRRGPHQGATPAASLLKRGAVPRRIGWSEGGKSSASCAVMGAAGKQLTLGSPKAGAAPVLQALWDVKVLIADKSVEARSVPRSPVSAPRQSAHSVTIKPKDTVRLRHRDT